MPRTRSSSDAADPDHSRSKPEMQIRGTSGDPEIDWRVCSEMQDGLGLRRSFGRSVGSVPDFGKW